MSVAVEIDLFVRRFEAEDPVGAIVLVHGLGEHLDRHVATLEAFAARGIVAYAYDQRGHGRSPGNRAYVEDFARLVADSLAIRDLAARERPALPLFVMGVSLGGVVVARSVAARPSGIVGVVLLAPALGIADAAPAWVQPIADALAKLAPRLPASRLDPAALSRSRAVGEAYSRDPLVLSPVVPIATGAALAKAARAALASARAWDVPTLLVHGDADRIVPIAASRRFVAAAAARDKTLREVAGGFHEPLNDPGGDALRDEIVSWVVGRALAARPVARAR